MALIAIAAYYPIKLIKFYCMESKEQSFKNQIIKDLRAGNLSRNLIKIILGDGALRLRRSRVDVICEWMVQNTNAWRVVIDDKGTVVVFSHTPFRPEDWDNVEDYKHVIRQMFGDFGTKDFLNRRCSMMESYRIRMNLKDLKEPTRVAVYDYVRMMFGGDKVLAMVVDVNDADEKLVAILSGTGKGQWCWVASTKAMRVIPNDEAISELVRLKEERKNKKREEFREARRIKFLSKYGNIGPGSYIKPASNIRPSLYFVESVDVEGERATAIRMIDLGLNSPAGEKCIPPLRNGFVLVSPDEVAMSNKKKLNSRDGATRITPDKYTGDFCGQFKLQVYSKASDSWKDLEGCAHLSWKDAAQARKNYVALRKACKVANGASLHINVPADEVNGN